MEIRFEEVSRDMIVTYHDGEPCGNKECKNSIIRPCWKCGRFEAKGETTIKIKGILVT